MSVSTVEQPDRAYTILQARRQYRCCHIQAPGEPRCQAAIEISGNYYGLLTVVKERARTIRVCDRLSATGKVAVVTPTIKGDVIWILEPDAVPVSRLPATRNAAIHDPVPSQGQSASEPERAILPTQHYPISQICLPELKMRLAALTIAGRRYQITHISPTLHQARDWAANAHNGQQDAIITSLNAGFAIWLHEPVA